MGVLCSNSCPLSNYLSDGDCDDGGPASDYDLCDLGSDCADCGIRLTSTGATDDGSWCSNMTAIWSADWGHDAGHDRSHLVVHADGQAFAFNAARSWSPAQGSVSGHTITMAFSGTVLTGDLQPPAATAGITAGRWTI
eukprot:4933386-Prymnesium_polylepis.1